VEEHRFIDIGMSIRGRVLFVVYTDFGGIAHLIGAREATATEKKDYENFSKR
jgi:uncharacterized DUF497 family protein